MKTFIVLLFTYAMYVISVATIILGLVTMFVPVQYSVFFWMLLMCIGIQTFLQIKKTLG